MLKILYLGQKIIGDRCFKTLTNLQNSNLKIIGAVSNKNNNVWWKTNKIYHQCQENNIPFISNNKRNNQLITDLIKEKEANTIISIQHPWILPASILALVNYNAFNFHNAKLPEYKGHNCCNHAILNNEQYYYSTLHFMSPEVDMGDIIYEETTLIEPTETAISLYAKTIKSSELLFDKLLFDLTNNKPLPRKPIIGNGSFYKRNSIDSYRQINNINDPSEVDTKARGIYFPPFEPAFYIENGVKKYILPDKHKEHECLLQLYLEV